MPYAIAFLLGCLLMPLGRRAGHAVGAVDRPEADSALKIHREPISLLGGTAVTLAALASIVVVGRGSPALVAATGVALVTGLVDDVRLLSPRTRLVLIAVAGIVAAGALADPESFLLRVALTLPLALACTNAVNLVDGQDLLAGSLAALGTLGMAGAAALLSTDDPLVAIGLGLSGALTAFLIWNRPPARVYLGSAGAYGVGLLLSLQAAALIAGEGWTGLVVATCCLAVPAFEVVSTIARRAAARTPLAAGDRGHTYDLLTMATGSRTRSTLVLIAIQAVLAALALVVAARPELATGAMIVLLVLAGAGGAAMARALGSAGRVAGGGSSG
jgi:UDP-GlcNAc:undecaprenyl-phosphate GlcNAc-1-phosphate transferase